MPDSAGNPTWDDYLGFWSAAQAANERKYQDQLGETRADRQARLTIANNQLRAERERIAIQRGQADADRWYREQQVRLAEGEQQLSRDRLSAETGLGLLGLRAKLKGPADWAQYLDLGEGFTSLQPSSGFLSAIAAGQRPATADVAFGGQPQPATLAALAGNTQDAQRARLNADLALATQIASNPGKIAPNVLGSLSQDRLDYLVGLAETGGYSGRTLMDAATRAGIGQGNPWAY